ncbi:MAG TPA: hypothetical protein VFU11_13280 [Solirubrobacterales bacterium]|nr:hypothetical protein [Solirubrobacterales bacterium]
MPQALHRRGPLALAFVLATIAMVVAVLVVHEGDATAENANPKWKQAAVQRLLRLHDLQPGYSFFIAPNEGGDELPPKIFCGRVEPADQQRKLKAFLDEHPIGGCFTAYVRFFPVGESRAGQFIGSGAVATPSPTVAMAGMAVAPQLLSHMFNDELPEEVPAPTTIGDETRLFHIPDFPIFLEDEAPSSLVAWRSGRVLAAVFVQGGDDEANDREAIALAQSQQRHIEAPTPYLRSERYDREAGFANPAIKVPVYWLGRTLRPQGSLPPLHLAGALSAGGFFEGLPGQRLGVYYSHDVALATWPEPGWEKFAGARQRPEMIDWRCTRTREVSLADGSATVYAAYDRDYKTCPKSAPTRYFALAELGGAVIAVNLRPACVKCLGAYKKDPYNTAAGVMAILRGLRLRPADG